jgi:hypothetical protein
MNYPATIDEVLAELDRIIETSLENNSPTAIFAYVYRRTTAEIKKGIEAGIFHDNLRMERFDVMFANHYIKAYYDYRENQDVSRSWHVSFEAAKESLCIVQHIIFGMNAHINLDLGVTAGTMMDGSELEELKEDFMKVNAILFSLTDEMQHSLGRVSRLMFLASWLGRNNDEKLINFSIGKARDFSWSTANVIWAMPGLEEKQARIREVDHVVADMAKLLHRPKGWVLRNVLKLIRRFEEKDVRRIIDGMKAA